MEGGAEYFSLSLYEDKRWWKEDFTPETEIIYWSKAYDKIDTTNDVEKSKLCFGDPDNGIPSMAGYAFAYKLFLNYVERNPNRNFRELLFVKPLEFIEAYKSHV